MNEKQVNGHPSPEGKEGLSGQRQRFSLSRLEIFFGGLLLLGLIYIGYLLFFQEGSDAALEKRLKRLEFLQKEQSEKIDREIKAIQTFQSQLDARLRALESFSRTGPRQTSSPAPTATSKAATQISTGSPPEEKRTPPSPVERKKILHKVKKGETLSSIAAKYKVSTKDLLAWNKKIKHKTVRPGDTLTIFSR